MNFGGPTDEATSVEIIHRAFDAGINFLDTANVYTGGNSETILGKAVAGKRDQFVIATKVHGPMGQGPNDRGNSRIHIMREVENSLRRLNTDWIDLYQLHRPDAGTPIEETLSALNDLVRQGKVRYVGTSTFPAWMICEALWISDRYGFERVACEQPPYSIFERGIEREVLPLCQKYGIGVIPWSPLAGGWLAGTYSRAQAPPAGTRGERGKWDFNTPENQRRLDLVDKLGLLAKRKGATLSQFALAWMLANPAVTAPIIGPRTLEHLEDNLGALEVQLTEEDLKAVDELAPPGTSI
jgi:aryl-alcohol dehydrogenase-like predicted oxidoreductase